MGNLVNSRNQRDELIAITTAFAAAGASANSASIDLGSEGPHREGMELEVTIPTLTALVDAKSITIEVEHSADDTTFTDLGDAAAENASSATISGGITAAVTGSETPGTPGEVVFRFAIPSHCNRYVRISQATEAAGGDNTGQSSTLRLLT